MVIQKIATKPWLCSSQGLSGSPWLLLPTNAIKMLGAGSATWDHIGVHGTCGCWGHTDLVTCAATEAIVTSGPELLPRVTSGSCYIWGLYWCLWPVTPQDAIGTMRVEICLSCPSLALDNGPCTSLILEQDAPWKSWLLHTGEIALPLNTGVKRAGPHDMDLGKLFLPHAWGGSLSVPDWPAQLPPRSTSWVLGCLTC